MPRERAMTRLDHCLTPGPPLRCEVKSSAASSRKALRPALSGLKPYRRAVSASFGSDGGSTGVTSSSAERSARASSGHRRKPVGMPAGSTVIASPSSRTGPPPTRSSSQRGPVIIVISLSRSTRQVYGSCSVNTASGSVPRSGRGQTIEQESRTLFGGVHARSNAGLHRVAR